MAFGPETVHNASLENLKSHPRNLFHMISQSIRHGFFLLLACVMVLPLHGQSTKNPGTNVIRPEYYLALERMADGQSMEATAYLDSALVQARIANDQRGIDSIPPLVMLGECAWDQCDIALALERYDAALQLSLQTLPWLTHLKSPGNIKPDARAREILWAPNTRGTQMGQFTDPWPISIGSPDALLELVSAPAQTGKMVTIDAMEVLRCQAIALRRRYLLLGPLSPHFGCRWLASQSRSFAV
jgi:hypothetical protein